MKLLGYRILEKEPEVVKQEITSYTRPDFNYGYGSTTTWAYSVFNGEKNLGSIGPATEYNIDGKALRTRGWEAYLTNETVQTIINKMVVWVIGRGLRLQAELKHIVLQSEGINLTKEQAQELSELIEARFSLFKEQRFSTTTEEKNLSQTESTTFKNAKVGGDILVMIEFDGEFPRVKLLDGCHVRSPQGGDDWNPRDLDNGNRIVNGVEMDEAGRHIAYHVQDAKLNWKRVLATSSSTGLRIAYLVGGIEYRLDYVRAMPAIAGILEVLSNMDGYKIATLETAKETSRISYQIKHGTVSTGENPIVKEIAKARDIGGHDGTIPVDDQLREMANKVAVSTGSKVVNNVIDSSIEPMNKNKGELYFKDFYSVFFDICCAAVNMPPNVAMSKYDTSFSSARAAIKDWEHSLIIERYNFGLSFLQPFYEMWLWIEVRKNKINLPGYLDAQRKNRMIVAAYNSARWIGDAVPHIDPLKEVEAIRAALGPAGEALPLITHERGVERLDNGEAKAVLQQFSTEVKEADSLGIKVVPKEVQPGNKKDDQVED